MKDMLTLECEPQVPAGMIRTLNGDILPDTGRSRLIAKLQEAYALDGAVKLNVDGSATRVVPLTERQVLSLDMTVLDDVDLDPATCTGIDRLHGDVFLLTYATGRTSRIGLSCSEYLTPQE